LRQPDQRFARHRLQFAARVFRHCREDAAARHQVPRQHQVERWQRDDDAAATGCRPEHDQRSEDGIAGDAEAQRRRPAARRAWPHPVTADAHVRRLRAQRAAQPTRREPDVGR